MTMLDRMRRHKGWLKWSLALVVVAFVLLYMPDFLSPGGGLSSDVIAEVDGREITANEFRRAYQAQLQAYRGAYGANVSEQLLRQLGIEQQILQQLVDQQAALAEASRLGIRVTDREVAQRILSLPAFLENGQFVGERRYEQMLAMARPPLSKQEFEESLRESIAIERLRAALTDWVAVPDAEVEEEFRRRNEKVKLEVAALPYEQLRDEVTVTDADVETHYEANKERYRVGERRRIRYLLVDVEALRARVATPERDVALYYEDNIDLYSTPEQVRASHVLLETEGKDDAAVRAEAERIAKEARAGRDFAELAKKHSDDEASAAQGGDLDYFSRGRMVPAFEEAAFSQEPGTISDPVKTDYGYHVIKVVDRKPATTRQLEEVKDQIAEQLALERAQAQADTLARTLAAEIRRPADLDRVATARGMTVQESGLFTREEPVLGLGMSPEVTMQAFSMEPGQVSPALRVSRGYAFIAVAGKEEPYVPALDEVRDRVREDAVRARMQEAARERLAGLAAAFKADFAKAAKQAGIDVQTTELIPRESPVPELGVNAAVDRAAFSLPQGGVSEPIAADNAVAVIRVVERQDPASEELAATRESLRQELLIDRQNRFFSAYMVEAKQRMKIEVNRETLERLIA
jgi:peptidyl-prolyl cis-trans isomerase D